MITDNYTSYYSSDNYRNGLFLFLTEKTRSTTIPVNDTASHYYSSSSQRKMNGGTERK